MYALTDHPILMNDEPSLARKGLDLLLREYPFADVMEVDSQEEFEEREDGVTITAGPWVIVALKEMGEFAIWKATGAVHRLNEDGGAEDDPILQP